ncbi:hypothetical protein A2799_03065 [Candidatus Roizmanbacteria bacterium RIFCSPHIGHO2_01_FULL_39_24]|uniref:Homing endonuclease LAGLIDADG domain-containing protein n=1 Tax=Candidatus Roizmanbacteria bacterium RIFCSPHIGHO2_01_FULL_39_24 TaxID=1802032 RepID=A0A1F7GJY7_9BACT|nr:MAG: hypothetical protein A2799_03065 [Candidatus Roizmanbacteria bacterium RIFCSPHIGHO2_01_FULL_39_24]
MDKFVHSENDTSRDNQQERLNPWWIVGFVDGEGCFSVSRFKNKTCKSGYQILFEFVITQGERSKESLESIKDYFGCGNIYINRRYDNHNYNLLRYCVRRQNDLKKIVVPFFRKHRLKTTKQQQFESFCKKLGV